MIFVKLINHFSKQSHRGPAAGFQGSLHFLSIPKEFEGSHPFLPVVQLKLKLISLWPSAFAQNSGKHRPLLFSMECIFQILSWENAKSAFLWPWAVEPLAWNQGLRFSQWHQSPSQVSNFRSQPLSPNHSMEGIAQYVANTSLQAFASLIEAVISSSKFFILKISKLCR